MSQPNDTGTVSDDEENEINYYMAASAGVAQAVALASQNRVDEMRNQTIVQRTAMGAAYAKWLENPQLGQTQFAPLIEEARTDFDKDGKNITTGLKNFRDLTYGEPAGD